MALKYIILHNLFNGFFFHHLFLFRVYNFNFLISLFLNRKFLYNLLQSADVWVPLLHPRLHWALHRAIWRMLYPIVIEAHVVIRVHAPTEHLRQIVAYLSDQILRASSGTVKALTGLFRKVVPLCQKCSLLEDIWNIKNQVKITFIFELSKYR